MITTSEIVPSPALAPYVRCYAHRELDTKGLDLIRPWHASHEISLSFHFKSLPTLLSNPKTGQIPGIGSYGFYTSYFSVFFQPTAPLIHIHFTLMVLWITMLIARPFFIHYES